MNCSSKKRRNENETTTAIVFTAEQNEWLEMIKDYIIANVRIEPKDIQETMDDKGGIIRERSAAGSDIA